jgi:hypothetical protein
LTTILTLSIPSLKTSANSESTSSKPKSPPNSQKTANKKSPINNSTNSPNSSNDPKVTNNKSNPSKTSTSSTSLLIKISSWTCFNKSNKSQKHKCKTKSENTTKPAQKLKISHLKWPQGSWNCLPTSRTQPTIQLIKWASSWNLHWICRETWAQVWMISGKN